jgi:tripartite-type tricarboxylate transporter receptor subunit TctC
MLAKVHNILAVHPSLPLKDVKEFIEYAKSYPGKLNYCSGGPGSAAHIATEAFALETGTQFVHVPYRGTLPAVTDLLSGQIQLMVTGAPALLPHVQNGNLRALGTASLTRLPSAKEIPTISEAACQVSRRRNGMELLPPRAFQTGSSLSSVRKCVWPLQIKKSWTPSKRTGQSHGP